MGSKRVIASITKDKQNIFIIAFLIPSTPLIKTARSIFFVFFICAKLFPGHNYKATPVKNLLTSPYDNVTLPFAGSCMIS